MGLRLGKALGAKNLLVQNNSRLVIGQIRGEYEAKEERMQKYLRLTKHLTQEFDRVEFVQVPRSQNMVADEVSKLASLEEGGRAWAWQWKSRNTPALKKFQHSQSRTQTAR